MKRLDGRLLREARPRRPARSRSVETGRSSAGREPTVRGGGLETVLEQTLAACLAVFGSTATAQAQTAHPVGCPAGEPREQAQRGWQQQSQGHWVEAEACLRAATAVATDPWVQGHRAQLDPSLRIVSEHVGGFQVLGGVPGAPVRVDGVEVATLPMEPIRVPATTLLVEVSAEGYRTTDGRVDVPHGERVWVETIPLVAAASAALPITPPAVIAPVVAAPDPHPSLRSVPADQGVVLHRGSTMRTLAWLAAAGAAVGVGVGIGGYVLGSGAANDYNVRYGSFRCPGSDRPNTGTCQSDLTNVGTGEALAVAGFVAGSVLAVTSVALFLVSPSSRASGVPTEARIGCGPGPGSLGLTCGGTF